MIKHAPKIYPEVQADHIAMLKNCKLTLQLLTPHILCMELRCLPAASAFTSQMHPDNRSDKI